MFKKIHTKNSPIPLGPYSQAIATNTGNLIFVSGQIGICPHTNNISTDIYDQTFQSLKNIKNIIESEKLKINNIIKTTLFIVEINDLPIINLSYKKFFEKYYPEDLKNCLIFPVRSCISVSNLPKNAKIEIDAIIAYTPN